MDHDGDGTVGKTELFVALTKHIQVNMTKQVGALPMWHQWCADHTPCRDMP